MPKRSDIPDYYVVCKTPGPDVKKRVRKVLQTIAGRMQEAGFSYCKPYHEGSNEIPAFGGNIEQLKEIFREERLAGLFVIIPAKNIGRSVGPRSKFLEQEA